MIEKTASIMSAAAIATVAGIANAEPVESGATQFVATYLVKKKDSMAFDAFRRYQLDSHAKLALALPGLKHYRLIFFPPQDGARQPADAMAQVIFDSADAYQTAMQSAQGQKALADLPNMLDMTAVQVLTTSSQHMFETAVPAR